MKSDKIIKKAVDFTKTADINNRISNLSQLC